MERFGHFDVEVGSEDSLFAGTANRLDGLVEVLNELKTKPLRGLIFIAIANGEDDNGEELEGYIRTNTQMYGDTQELQWALYTTLQSIQRDMQQWATDNGEEPFEQEPFDDGEQG